MLASGSDDIPGRVLSDRSVVVLAVATWLGATVALPVPVWLGGVIAALAAGARRPVLLVVGVALLGSALADRSWAGTTPVKATMWSGTATLATDPEPVTGSVRVVAIVDGRRVEAWARGSPARALRPRLAGEKVELVGELAPPRPAMARRLAVRHIVGRLTVREVAGWHRAEQPWGAANALRRLLTDGAVSLPPTSRALLAGLVLGDDREQPAELANAFEGAGLTHLLAVSGQNVAFVLAVAGPGLQRLGLR
ncbi:MAG: competence protein ComEC, partial [Acidimicrobiia bacterium]|nr:competence protein ComEC [Acidimicrobiia bacterium]